MKNIAKGARLASNFLLLVGIIPFGQKLVAGPDRNANLIGKLPYGD